MIAKLWYQEIILERRTFKEVPPKLKEQVRQLLIDANKEQFIIE